MTDTTHEPATVEVTQAAREALFQVEMARTHLVRPVNGSHDYFYVSFAGQRIEFRMSEDVDALRGPIGQEMAALSDKAARAATSINDLLFDLAKHAAAAARHRTRATRQDGLREAGWSYVAALPMWSVAVVTDGERVAIAQKAETDFDGYYWAIEPEDALDWEPTHCIALPAALSDSSTREESGAARHLEVGHDEQPGDYLRDGLLNIAAICEAKALHVEAASLRSTAAIVSEQLRKGQQTPEATQASASRVKMLRGLLQEFVEAMERYQMDVDDDAPPRHRDMMERAYAALSDSSTREESGSDEALKEQEFNRGVLIAVSTLINCWGRGTETEHLLAMINATPEMVEQMGFDNYDREPLLAALSASPEGEG